MATHSSIPAWRIPWTGDPSSPYVFKELDTAEQLILSLPRERACLTSLSLFIAQLCEDTGEVSCSQARKKTLTRKFIGWYFDPGLLSFQNYKK